MPTALLSSEASPRILRTAPLTWLRILVPCRTTLVICRTTIVICSLFSLTIGSAPAQSAVIPDLTITVRSRSIVFQAQATVTKAQTAAPVRFVKGYVVDHRLSALRRQPDQKSHVLRRLSLGRPVYVFGSKQTYNTPLFYRVAVTRRTRGWIHSKAVVIPGRAGHDQVVWSLIRESESDFDRISLCRILLERFQRSRYVPKAFLQIAGDAESAGTELTRRARRRLSHLEADQNGITIRDFYLNDPALDRYNRLGIRFDFDSQTGSLIYDGEAYRELISRFPRSAEAETARSRLANRPNPAMSPSN